MKNSLVILLGAGSLMFSLGAHAAPTSFYVSTDGNCQGYSDLKSEGADLKKIKAIVADAEKDVAAQGLTTDGYQVIICKGDYQASGAKIELNKDYLYIDPTVTAKADLEAFMAANFSLNAK